MITAAIELPADHPGVTDPVYLERRATIAAVSASHVRGMRPAHVHYTDTEHGVWRTVLEALRGLHGTYATDEYQIGAAALQLPTDRIPQLADVADRLHDLTGWRVEGVPGLVPTREFYGALAERTFLSTQYVRHPSVPFYTPEPDVIHELIGHVNALASPRLAALHEAAGKASLRATDDEMMQRFSKVFWFTLEFGVTHQRNELRTYGAGLLSSFGEIQAFRRAEIRPFEIDAMSVRDYDITAFQDVLFAGASFDEIESRLLDYFARF
jgi:phenylalanine-4-hydroxylase